jgi:hypothetical protein
MNSRGRYSVRVEGAKYGTSFGTALANRDFVHRPKERDRQFLRHVLTSPFPRVACPRGALGAGIPARRTDLERRSRPANQNVQSPGAELLRTS